MRNWGLQSLSDRAKELFVRMVFLPLLTGAGWYILRLLSRQHSAATRGTYKLIGSPTPGSALFIRAVAAIAFADTSEGNRLQILRNGDEISPSMLEAIGQAHCTINLVTFVYWNGPIAVQMAQALCERATAGVKCNLLLDAFGSAKINRKLIKQMRQAGVNVKWFRPLSWSDLTRLDNRTHRKVLVIDGRVGFIGGVGIAKEWMGHAQDRHHWRDTHLRIEGPAVASLQGAFGTNWFEATGETLADEAYLPLLKECSDGGAGVQVICSSASKYDTNIEALFLLAIASATKSLWIATAYFVPTGAFTKALITAAKKGVDVRVLTAGPYTNKKMVQRAGRVSYYELLKAQVRIFEYQPTMFHAKTMVVDGLWGTVGSSNFDNRSFSLNDEVNVSFQDSITVETLTAHFQKDLELCQEMSLAKWSKRGPVERFLDKSSDLLNPEL